MAYRMYSQVMRRSARSNERQVAPLVARVNALMTRVDDILVDVKDVTGRVTHQTERVDSAIRSTIDRVDETAGRVRESVAHRVHRVLGLVKGARSAFDSLFNGRRASGEAPGHA